MHKDILRNSNILHFYVILNLTEQPQVLNNYFNIYQIHILEIFKNKLFQKTKLYILSNIKIETNFFPQYYIAK